MLGVTVGTKPRDTHTATDCTHGATGGLAKVPDLLSRFGLACPGKASRRRLRPSPKHLDLREARRAAFPWGDVWRREERIPDASPGCWGHLTLHLWDETAAKEGAGAQGQSPPQPSCQRGSP